MYKEDAEYNDVTFLQVCYRGMLKHVSRFQKCKDGSCLLLHVISYTWQ